jgi:hypothetical protein
MQVLWLNNPSRDKSHAHLSKQLQQVLNMYPGRLGPMAVNLMHIVSVGDPLSPECIALAGSLQRTAQRYELYGHPLCCMLAHCVTCSCAVCTTHRSETCVYEACSAQLKGMSCMVIPCGAC